MLIHKSIVMNSATGTAIQTPVTPRKRGSIIRLITINTRVLENDTIADIFPLESAVNIPEEKILNPLNRKLYAKILNPTTASS